MEPADLEGVLEFLRSAEELENTLRTAWTSAGANPQEFDYRFDLEGGHRFDLESGHRFDLEGGHRFTTGDPLLEAVRAVLDPETARRAREAEGEEA